MKIDEGAVLDTRFMQKNQGSKREYGNPECVCVNGRSVSEYVELWA